MRNLGRQNKGRRFWQFRAAAEPGVGELLLYGEISDVTWWGDEVTPKQFWDDLQALGEISELRVYINSPGGDVFAGQAIYSMLRRHSATVLAYIDGLAASAASLVAMAGDRVIMPRNAIMMIHNPWTLAWGNANDLRAIADDLDKIRESMIAVYEEKTGLERQQIVDMLDAETWMTAEEAVERGFADEIEEAKAVAALAAGPDRLVINGVAVDLSRYQNPPKLFTPGAATVSLHVDPEALARALADRLAAENGAASRGDDPPERADDKCLRLLALELELLTGSSS